jgi:hypothetical protein
MLRRQRVNYTPRVPSGMIAKTEKGYFYVKGEKRFRFISDRARDSWRLRTAETSELAMSNYKIVGIVGFRDGTLIKDISNGKIYLIVDNKKNLVVDPDDLKALGFTKNDIVLVSKKEADFQKEGETLNAR